MKILLNLLFKYLLLFDIGGISYVLIEIMFRGNSHVSMYILGGICFICIGLINEIFPWDMALTSQMLLSSAMVTTLELVTGIIVNLWLDLKVWNYSLMPYNFLGQICLLFSIIWVILSLLGILVDDWLRYKLLKEEKPRYKIF